MIQLLVGNVGYIESFKQFLFRAQKRKYVAKASLHNLSASSHHLTRKEYYAWSQVVYN